MTATEMDEDEYKTWAFLDELEKEQNQEQQRQMWHEIVMNVAEQDAEKAQKMMQVSEIMGIYMAWKMFKAVEEK